MKISAMKSNFDNSLVLRGLMARLEMETDLGIDYISHSTTIFSEIKLLNHPTSSATPLPVSEVKPSKIYPPIDTKKDEPTRAIPVSPAIAPSLPQGYVSLVPFTPPPPAPEKEAMLGSLRDECLSCTACGLCEKRNNVAWGEGNLDAQVMFIGEGPGRDEDREGRPFVGRSGRLLTDIIEKGMKTPRNQVFIANVVKCRPPGNRDPRPEEVSACSRYLNRQIEVIAPKIIVAVGGVAGCALLGLPPKTPGLRGKWHYYRDIPMRVIFHPSYLLRQRRTENDRTDADRKTWSDVQEVMTKLKSML